MKGCSKLFIFCMIFVINSASAQQKTINANAIKPFNSSSFFQSSKIFSTHPYLSIVKPDFFLNNESFFCMYERKFENATRVPLRFRLGSLQYCNWLEGKPNAIINY